MKTSYFRKYEIYIACSTREEKNYNIY